MSEAPSGYPQETALAAVSLAPGLSTGVVVAIVISSIVLVAAAVGIFLFRKYTVNPSERFKQRVVRVPSNQEMEEQYQQYPQQYNQQYHQQYSPVMYNYDPNETGPLEQTGYYGAEVVYPQPYYPRNNQLDKPQ